MQAIEFELALYNEIRFSQPGRIDGWDIFVEDVYSKSGELKGFNVRLIQSTRKERRKFRALKSVQKTAAKAAELMMFADLDYAYRESESFVA